MERTVRTSAKALVIKDGKMLAIKVHDSDGDFCIMPGGGQNAGELLSAAVEREVAEETGIKVKAKDTVFIIEGSEGDSSPRRHPRTLLRCSGRLCPRLCGRHHPELQRCDGRTLTL